MGSIKSYRAFQEQGPAKAGEFFWTLMVKVLDVSKSDLYYEQFVRGKFTLSFADGSSLEKLMKDVTLQNPSRLEYPNGWYEDMQPGESSGPKAIPPSNDIRIKCAKISENEIFYQWWDWPGVPLDVFQMYTKTDPWKAFVGIEFEMEVAHKLWESDAQLLHPTHKNHLMTFIIALTGTHMLTPPAPRDTRHIEMKAAGRFL